MVMSLISDGENEVVKDKKGLNVRIVFVSATLLVLLLFGVRRCNLKTTDPATLDSLRTSQAMQIAKSLSPAYLNNVVEITPDVAGVLSEHRGGGLYLNGLKSLTPETASVLSSYKGDLVLAGLSSVSVQVACELARHRDGSLILSGLVEISPEVAACLAKKIGPLFLNGLIDVNYPVLEALSKHNGDLCLDGLQNIEPEGLQTLVSHRGRVFLRQLADGVKVDKKIQEITSKASNLILE